VLDRVGVCALVSASVGEGEEMLDGLSVARYYLTQIYSRSPYPRERALAAYYLGYLAEQMGDFRTSRYWYDIAKRTHPRSFI
jgi:hypothetical protein